MRIDSGKKSRTRSSTPSKLYGIMAAGRPILASIDLGSEVDTIVARADIGRTVPPDDAPAFLAALEAMLADSAELAEMGRRARRYVEVLLTPATQAEAYESLFAELLARRSPNA